jgi:hypothetical protein
MGDIDYAKLFYAVAYNNYLEYVQDRQTPNEIDVFVSVNCNLFFENYALYANDIINNVWTHENRTTDFELVYDLRFPVIQEAYDNIVLLESPNTATVEINGKLKLFQENIRANAQLSKQFFINEIETLNEDTVSSYELESTLLTNISGVFNINTSNYIDLAINLIQASNYYESFNSNFQDYINHQQYLASIEALEEIDIYTQFITMNTIYTDLLSNSNQFYKIFNDFEYTAFSNPTFSNFYISLDNNYQNLQEFSNQIQTNLSRIDSNFLFKILINDLIDYIESMSSSLSNNELQINSFSDNWPNSNSKMSNNLNLQGTLHPDYAVILVNSNEDIYNTTYLDYTNIKSTVFNQLDTISNNVFTYSNHLRKLIDDNNFASRNEEINSVLSNADATFTIIERISNQEYDFDSIYNDIYKLYIDSSGHFTKASTIDALASNISIILASNIVIINTSSNLYTINIGLYDEIENIENISLDNTSNDVLTLQSNLNDIKSNCLEIGNLISEQFEPLYSNVLGMSNILDSYFQDLESSNLKTQIISEFESRINLMYESNDNHKTILSNHLQESKTFIINSVSIQKNIIDEINVNEYTYLYFTDSVAIKDTIVLPSTSNEYIITNDVAFFESNHDIFLFKESVILESRKIGLRNGNGDLTYADWNAIPQTSTGDKFIASNQYLTIDLDFFMEDNELYLEWSVDDQTDRYKLYINSILYDQQYPTTSNKKLENLNITQEIFVSKTNIFNDLVESKKCVLTGIPSLDTGEFQTDDNSIYYKNIFTSFDYTYYDKVDITVSIETPSLYKNINIWKRSSDTNILLLDFSMFSNTTVFEVKVKITLQLDISNQDELLFYEYPDNTYTIHVEKPTVQTKYDYPEEYIENSNAPITIFDYFDESTRFGYIRTHQHTIVQYTNNQNYTIVLDQDDQYGDTLIDIQDETGSKSINIFKTKLIFKKEDEIFNLNTPLEEKLKSIGYGRLYINPLDDPTYNGYMLKIETIDSKPYLIYDTINTSDLKGLFRIEQLSLNATYGLRYRDSDSLTQNFISEREVKIGNILELESLYWKMIGDNNEFKLATMDERIMSYNIQNYNNLYLIGIDDSLYESTDYNEIIFYIYTGSGGAIQFRTNINGSIYVLNVSTNNVILEPLRTDIHWLVNWYYETLSLKQIKKLSSMITNLDSDTLLRYISIKYMDNNYLGYNNYKELFLNLGTNNTITTSETNNNLFTLRFNGVSLIPQTPYNFVLRYNKEPAKLSFALDDDINIDFIKLYNISLDPNFPHLELSSHNVVSDTNIVTISDNGIKIYVLQDEQQIIKTNTIDTLNIGLKVVRNNISSQFASSNPSQSQTENSPSTTQITLVEYAWDTTLDVFFSKIQNISDSGVVDQGELIGGNNNSGNVIISEDRYFQIIKPSKVSNIQVRKTSENIFSINRFDIAEFTFDNVLNTSVEYYKLYKTNEIDEIIYSDQNTFALLIDYNTIYGEYYITANNSTYTQIVSDKSYFTIVQPIKPTLFSINYISEDTYRFTWNSLNVSDPNRKYRIYRKDNDSDDDTYQILNITDGTEDIIKLKSYLQIYISTDNIFSTFAITEIIIETGFESEYSDPIVIREPYKILSSEIAINYMNAATEDEIGVYQISWTSSNNSDLYTYDIYYEPDNTITTRQQINSLPLSEKTLRLNNTIFTGSWFIVENIFDESTYDSISVENKLVIEPKVLSIQSIDARENPIYKINFKFTTEDGIKTDVGDCYVIVRKIGYENQLNDSDLVSKVDNRLYRYLSVGFPEQEAFSTEEQEILVSLEIKVYDVSRLVHDTKFLNISHIFKDASEITSTLEYKNSTYSSTYLRYPSNGLVFKYLGLFNNYVRSEIINQTAGESSIDGDTYQNEKTGEETLIFGFYVNSFQNEEITLFSIGKEPTRNLRIKLYSKYVIIYGNNNYKRTLNEYQIKINVWYHIIITNTFGETAVYMYFEDRHHTDHIRSQSNENISIALSGNIETEISIGYDRIKLLQFNGKITDIVYYTRKLDYSEIIRAFSPFLLDPWWFRYVSLKNQNDIIESEDEIIKLENEIQNILFIVIQNSMKIRLVTTIKNNDNVDEQKIIEITSVSETDVYPYEYQLKLVDRVNKYLLYFINNSSPNYFTIDNFKIVLQSSDYYLLYRNSFNLYSLNDIQISNRSITYFDLELLLKDEFDIFDLSTSNKEFYLYNSIGEIIKYDVLRSKVIMTDIENDFLYPPIKFKATFIQFDDVSPSTNDYQKIHLEVSSPTVDGGIDFFNNKQFEILINHSKYDGTTNGIYIKDNTNKYLYNDIKTKSVDFKITTSFSDGYRFFVVYDFTAFNYNKSVYFNEITNLVDANFVEETGIYVQIPDQFKNSFISLLDTNFSGLITTGGILNFKFAFQLKQNITSKINIFDINQDFTLEIDTQNRLSIANYTMVHVEIETYKWYYLTLVINRIQNTQNFKLFLFSYDNGLTKVFDNNIINIDYTSFPIAYTLTTHNYIEITDVAYLTHNALENRHILHLYLINTVDPWWDRIISVIDINSKFKKLLNNQHINQKTTFKLTLTGLDITPLQRQKEIDIGVINNEVVQIIKLEDPFGQILDNDFIMITEGSYIILKDIVEDLYVHIDRLGYFHLYELHEFRRARYPISKFNIKYSLFELEEGDELFIFDGNVKLVNEVVKLSTIYKNISSSHSLLLYSNNDNNIGIEVNDGVVEFGSYISFLSYSREYINDIQNNQVGVWDSGNLGEDLYEYQTSGYGTFMILLKNINNGHTGLTLGKCLSKDENDKIIQTPIQGSNNRNNIFKLKPSTTRGCVQIVYDDTGETEQNVQISNGDLIVSSGNAYDFKIKMIDIDGNGDFVYEIEDDVYDNQILDRSELTESYIVSKTVDAFTFSSDTEINLESNKKIEFNTPNLLLNGIQLHEYVRHVIFSEQYIQYANQDLHMVEKLIEPLSNIKVIETTQEYVDLFHSSNISYDMTQMNDNSSSSFSVSNIFTSNISSHLSHIRRVEETTRYPIQYSNYPIHSHPPEDTHTEINDINVSYCNCFHHAITISAKNNIYIKNTSDIENIEFNRDSNNTNLKSRLGVYISNVVGNATMPVALNEISQLGVVSTIEEPIGTQSINALVEDWWNQPIPKEILSDSFNLVINDDKQKTYSWKILRNTRIVGSSYKSEPLNETYTLNYYKLKCISLGENCLGFSHNKEEALIQLKTDTSELIPNVSYDSYFKI